MIFWTWASARGPSFEGCHLYMVEFTMQAIGDRQHPRWTGVNVITRYVCTWTPMFIIVRCYTANIYYRTKTLLRQKWDKGGTGARAHPIFRAISRKIVIVPTQYLSPINCVPTQYLIPSHGPVVICNLHSIITDHGMLLLVLLLRTATWSRNCSSECLHQVVICLRGLEFKY